MTFFLISLRCRHLIILPASMSLENSIDTLKLRLSLKCKNVALNWDLCTVFVKIVKFYELGWSLFENSFITISEFYYYSNNEKARGQKPYLGFTFNLTLQTNNCENDIFRLFTKNHFSDYSLRSNMKLIMYRTPFRKDIEEKSFD